MLNSDSMAQGTPGRIDTGGVVLDHMVVIIRAYCLNVDIGMTFLAEILTVIRDIEFDH